MEAVCVRERDQPVMSYLTARRSSKAAEMGSVGTEGKHQGSRDG